jgi:conjugative relaxase-like TrwC/TraI family protein
MRSIHTIKSGNLGKKNYYTKDESLGNAQKSYYANGVTQGQSHSAAMTQAIWFGADAERLNLKGHAQQSDFVQIFDGYIPGTNQRIRGEKPRADHQENCIYDVVLTCKKSVSMQIHLGKDERLYQAYQETVKEIAELIEKDYAQARIQVNGVRRIVKTDGITALMIPHHTTRSGDMGVHTHLAIANGTFCPDGEWRSLLDRGFSHAYYMGDYFSSRLAQKVQALGYEIRSTTTEEGHPSWELAGYSNEQIKVFSKRSENAKVKELVAAGMSRDDALMHTRQAKQVDENLESAQLRWEHEAEQHGIEAIIPSKQPIVVKRRISAEQALEGAIQHYSHRSVHFTRDQVREYAFKLNQSFSIDDLDKAITAHRELIDYGAIRGVDELQGCFTTVHALERELSTLQAWMKGQGKATPILDRQQSTQLLEDVSLKSGQREAIVGVLASNNQHQVIHGLAGVGKTTALRQLKRLTDTQGVQVLGFAPSIDAAQKLSEELGITTHTVQKLVKQSSFDLKPNQLLVIDEAGMVSAEMLAVIINKANAVRARVLLVGDTGQNQAIEAGSPLRSVMAHGAEVHHIGEIIRQQNSVQRRAVELIATGNGLGALSLLNEHGYLNQIEDHHQRVNEIASAFLGLSLEEQRNTLIVAGTNAEKDAIASVIRAGQKAAGILGDSASLNQLRDRALTPEQAKEIAFYRVGDYLSLSRNYSKVELDKDIPYRVVGKIKEELLVASPEGTLFQFNPQLCKDKRVFECCEFNIAVGDDLRWTSSNSLRGQVNGETFKVTALNGRTATILTKKGIQQIDLAYPVAVDYTLVSTSYRAQGSDRYRVFVSATDDPTSNREPFYVAISRQIKELKVWTQDYSALEQRVTESSVQQNPLELLDNVKPINQPAIEWTVNGSPTVDDPRADPEYSTSKSNILGRDDGDIAAAPSRDTRRGGRVIEGKRRQERHPDRSREIDFNGRSRYQSPERAHENTQLSNCLAGDSDRLSEIAEQIYRIRLQHELAEPLAQLQSKLAELREVKQLNANMQGNISERLHEILAESKVEVLATTLDDWRTRQHEQALELLVPTADPAQKRELSELLDHIPAQIAIQFALEEYSTASNHIIDLNASLKSGTPVFRLDELQDMQQVKREPSKQLSRKAPPPPRKRQNNSGDELELSDAVIEVKEIKPPQRLEGQMKPLSQPKPKPALQVDGLRPLLEHRSLEQPKPKPVPRQQSQSARAEAKARADAEYKVLINEVRDRPLEEIAERLGLQRDKRDKKKWRGEGFSISITDSKFYDHHAQKGGHGAIDLVMHVNQSSFTEAVDWLAGRSHHTQALPSFSQRSSSSPVPNPKPEAKPEKWPSCNIGTPDTWSHAFHYLTQRRGLPAELVNQLRQEGLIASDSYKNILFFRHQLDTDFQRGDAIGANLRGSVGNFKGLSTGTIRKEGYSWFQIGDGATQRVVLVESSIDAISLAKIESDQGVKQSTIYLSVDGNGAIPVEALRKFLDQGDIVVATDNDQGGEQLAWQIAAQVPAVTRMTPKHGKDWNDRLRGIHKDELNEIKENWLRIATALNKPESYRQEIQSLLSMPLSKESLPDTYKVQFQKDVADFENKLGNLRYWFFCAYQLRKDPEHLQRITDVAISFNDLRHPKPSSDQLQAEMAVDIKEYDRQAQKMNRAAWKLITELGKQQPDGTILLPGNHLTFSQQLNELTVTLNASKQKILVAQGSRIRVYRPRLAEDLIEKLYLISNNIDELHRQQQQQQPRSQRQGPRLL